MTNESRQPLEDLLQSTHSFQRPPGTVGQQIVMRAPDQLRSNPRNARTHSKRQVQQIANSISGFGFVGAIIIDEEGVVVWGDAVLAATRLLKWDLVPTLTVAGLNATQKRALALAGNKLAANAGWNREMLVVELGELAELLPPLNLDLAIIGFDPAEIDQLFADLGDEKPDSADAVPPFEDAVSRPGDLWCVGRHRVLCGDARSRADLDRLMAGGKARMAFLDLPYNISVRRVVGRGQIKHREFACASGEMSDPAYVVFLKESLGNAARVSTDGAVHYVCNDWRHICELIVAGRAVYGAMLNVCVWTKTNAGQGSFYRSQHELIAVFRVGEASHQNNVELGRFGRNRSNVWTYPGINSFGAGRLDLLAMHPTVKPIALIADAMRDCTTKNDAVLDTFLGSGTTILAAEKIGRRGYGLELEPRYVDVAIRRWEAYTRAEAVLDGDGRTFAEVKAERLKARHDVDRQAAPDPHASGRDATPATVEDHDETEWALLCDTVTMTPTAGEPR